MADLPHLQVKKLSSRLRRRPVDNKIFSVPTANPPLMAWNPNTLFVHRLQGGIWCGKFGEILCSQLSRSRWRLWQGDILVYIVLEQLRYDFHKNRLNCLLCGWYGHYCQNSWQTETRKTKVSIPVQTSGCVLKKKFKKSSSQHILIHRQAFLWHITPHFPKFFAVRSHSFLQSSSTR